MRHPGSRAWLVSVACSLTVACSAAAADSGGVTHLGVAAASLSGIASSPNGQTVYGIDASRRAVVAIDPVAAGRCRDVVGAAGEGSPAPMSIAALPGDILAVVCRAGDEWLVRTYRTRPAEPVDAEQPVQELRFGAATGPRSPLTTVSRTRDWFAVAGLPPPLPSVVRVAFAGAGMRRRPEEPTSGVAAARVVAIAGGPADELVTFEAAEPNADATVVFTGPSGRELLRLDAGVADVRGAAFARDGSALWVIAGAAGRDGRQPAGVWRLDAVVRDGRQAVRPTCVLRLADPRAVAPVSERGLVVVHGVELPSISRIDFGGPGAKAGGSTESVDEEQSR